MSEIKNTNYFEFTGKIKRIIDKPNSKICRIVTSGFSKTNYPQIVFIKEAKEALEQFHEDDYVTIKGKVQSFKNIVTNEKNERVVYLTQKFMAESIESALTVSESEFGVKGKENRYSFENKVSLRGSIKKIKDANKEFMNVILTVDSGFKYPDSIMVAVRTTDKDKFNEKYKVGDHVHVTAIASTRSYLVNDKKVHREEILCDMLIKAED